MDTTASEVSSFGRRNSVARDGVAVEILHLIFQFNPIATCSRRNEFPSWLTPLHVCRSWRAAALSCADLWGRVPLNNQFMAKFAAEHAEQLKRRCLTVSAYPGSFVDLEALSLVESHSAHITTLVCPYTMQWDEIIRRTNKLENVSIWRAPTPSSKTKPADTPASSYRFETDLFGGSTEMHRIKELRIHSNIHKFDTGLLVYMPLLTSLEITLSRRLWQTLEELFTHLRAFPQLQSLALRNLVLPNGLSADPGPPSTDAAIALQNLHSLCLEASDSVLTRILQYLFIPNCTRFSLRSLLDDLEMEEWDAEVSDADFVPSPPWDINRQSHEQLTDIVTTRSPSEHPMEHLHLAVSDRSMLLEPPNELWQTFATLPGVIGRFQHLRTLVLRFGWVLELSIDKRVPEPAYLPLLEYLHISAPWDIITPAIRVVRAPESARRSYSIRSLDIMFEGEFERMSEDVHAMVDFLFGADWAGASYTHLDIVPAQDSPLGGVRVAASGRTHTRLPRAIDISFTSDTVNPNDRRSNKGLPESYTRALSELLFKLPLSTLDTVYISDAANAFLDHTPDAVDPRIFESLAHAREITVAFHPSPVAPLLRAISSATSFNRLERVTLRSITINSNTARGKPAANKTGFTGLASCPPAPSRNTPIKVVVKHCAIWERDLQKLRAWAGEANYEWDGRKVVDSLPSCGAGDWPWMAPDTREVRFWRPDIFEEMYWTPTDALVED